MASTKVTELKSNESSDMKMDAPTKSVPDILVNREIEIRKIMEMNGLPASDHDLADYLSWAQMFGGPDTNIYEFEWHQFILTCVVSPSCSIQDLCKRFSV